LKLIPCYKFRLGNCTCSEQTCPRSHKSSLTAQEKAKFDEWVAETRRIDWEEQWS
jgi:hypothetical protein